MTTAIRAPGQPSSELDHSAPRRAIISPAIDLLCAGGLSIVVFVPLLLSGRSDLVILSVGVQAWVGIFLNLPHFMASYRMVYRSREMIARHRWAAIYVPLLLIGYIVVAIWRSPVTDRWVTYILTAQGCYLAWHYTGQAWGMVATHTWLAGKPLSSLERFLIRDGLRLLTLWQVTWFIHWFYTNGQLTDVYRAVTFAMVIPLAAGAIGFFLYRMRTGQPPPAAAIVAWGAVFVWYLVLGRDIKALFWVQNAHALQYLVFPLRVEMNRTNRTSEGRMGRFFTHMAIYVALIILASVLWSELLPGTAMDIVAKTLGEQPGIYAGMMVMTFLNIHHFFTDGVMWKLRNPDVRADLFGHLPVPAQAAAGSLAAAPRSARRRSRRG
jgi:hypothetical protein